MESCQIMDLIIQFVEKEANQLVNFNRLVIDD
ncbi:MAG: hypothetical protein ACI9KN_000925 [Gammaproteobacteria bacterium]|jgi:hypothetical protein